MGRKPRVEFEGAVYHVIKRGNNRAQILESREDKEDFLKCLEAANDEVAFNLLGYVIMDNHYHLFIETKEKPLNISAEKPVCPEVRVTESGQWFQTFRHGANWLFKDFQRRFRRFRAWSGHAPY